MAMEGSALIPLSHSRITRHVRDSSGLSSTRKGAPICSHHRFAEHHPILSQAECKSYYDIKM